MDHPASAALPAGRRREPTEFGGLGGSAVLALGSNIADRLAYLRAAVASIAAEHGVLAASGVYETLSVGGPAQDDYLNAVVLVPAADPRDLLDLARRCEARAQRVRTVRWGPRTLDVDVIACGTVRSNDPEILLPHPKAHERAFVCVPWLEVDSSAVLVGHGPVAGLVAGMVADGRAAGLRRTGHQLLVGEEPRRQAGPGGRGRPRRVPEAGRCRPILIGPGPTGVI